jgi:hypothetical protein
MKWNWPVRIRVACPPGWRSIDPYFLLARFLGRQVNPITSAFGDYLGGVILETTERAFRGRLLNYRDDATKAFHWFVDRETPRSARAQAITRRLC